MALAGRSGRGRGALMFVSVRACRKEKSTSLARGGRGVGLEEWR